MRHAFPGFPNHSASRFPGRATSSLTAATPKKASPGAQQDGRPDHRDHQAVRHRERLRGPAPPPGGGRTLAWLGRCRRLDKDGETTTASTEGRMMVAHIRLTTRGSIRYCFSSWSLESGSNCVLTASPAGAWRPEIHGKGSSWSRRRPFSVWLREMALPFTWPLGESVRTSPSGAPSHFPAGCDDTAGRGRGDRPVAGQQAYSSTMSGQWSDTSGF